MNELLAPLYYVFANDPVDGEFAEPDAYFCFENVMVVEEIEQSFCRQYDSSMMLTSHPVGRFWALLALKDRELFVSLVRKGFDPRFFALRWLSLLFSQEMELPDVLRLWDSIFGDPNRFSTHGDQNRFWFLLFFAVAVLMRMRDDLMETEFAPCLVKLQDLQIPDVTVVIRYATELMNNTPPEHLDPEFLACEADRIINEINSEGTAPQQSSDKLHHRFTKHIKMGLFGKKS